MKPCPKCGQVGWHWRDSCLRGRLLRVLERRRCDLALDELVRETERLGLYERNQQRRKDSE